MKISWLNTPTKQHLILGKPRAWLVPRCCTYADETAYFGGTRGLSYPVSDETAYLRRADSRVILNSRALWRKYVIARILVYTTYYSYNYYEAASGLFCLVSHQPAEHTQRTKRIFHFSFFHFFIFSFFIFSFFTFFLFFFFLRFLSGHRVRDSIQYKETAQPRHLDRDEWSIDI